MSAPTRIDLIRHGEPVGGRRYRGHGVDDPLSETGWRQMWQAVEAGPMGWSRVVSSPLRRCRAFAEALAARIDRPLELDEALREVGFGCWEGCSPAEIQAGRPDEYTAFLSDPVRNRPPGAEALDAFSARVVDAFERILRDHAGEHLIVVAHAGVLRAVAAHCLAAPLASIYRLRIDNAAFVSITATSDGRRLVDGINRPVIRP